MVATDTYLSRPCLSVVQWLAPQASVPFSYRRPAPLVFRASLGSSKVDHHGRSVPLNFELLISPSSMVA
jgi:hypothetical protein